MPQTKPKNVYVCNQCGFESPRWQGKCPECEQWNTFTEELRLPTKPSKTESFAGVASNLAISHISDIEADEEKRFKTGMKEFDRVLGGGVVRGSLILLAGEPGIGKSTLMLQVCRYFGKGLKVLYVSGEESRMQVKLRAVRLGVESENLMIAAGTDIEDIINAIRAHKPDIVMIDSIQTVNLASLNSSSGSVSQVRECANLLSRVAKEDEVSIFLVGHVNKDGAVAGPKVLEHIVDVVVLFEGDNNYAYRILRAAKNRFGSTNEIGVFEMHKEGLRQVENPSAALLDDRPEGVSGTCAACVVEGSRPIMAEIQALATKTGFSVARRVSSEFNYNRMALLIAVIEKRAGFFLGNLDVYVNVIGGLKLDEPAVDLPVSLAIMSSLTDKPIPNDLAAFGEIGLAGELRAVAKIEERVAEAAKLGFTRCIIPLKSAKGLNVSGIQVLGAKNLSAAFGLAVK